MIKGLNWVGTRTDRFDELTKLYRDTMAVKVTMRKKTSSSLSCRMTTRWKRSDPQIANTLHFDTGPVTGFAVGDIHAARKRLEAGDARFIRSRTAMGTDG